jgi:hypothetical protein
LRQKRDKLKIASAPFHHPAIQTAHQLFLNCVCIVYRKKNSQAFCFFSQGVDQIYEKMALMRIAAYCINIALHSHSPQDDAMLCQELTTGILLFAGFCVPGYSMK